MTDIEQHPLQPFLPTGAKLLMLGSFPPPKPRWCMDFFYPNPQNDMWRIMGLLFYGDKLHFVNEQNKFRYGAIVSFCEEKGIALFDTAQAVRRLKGNASDNFLEVVEPTNIADLLRQLPDCHDLCCTGQKSAEILAQQCGCQLPHIGDYVEGHIAGRPLRLWRMPSSSRAYPLSLEKKAAVYGKMMQTIGLLTTK